MDKPLLQQVSPLTSRRTLSVDRKDGIYSWIIALGLCLINCIDDGVLKGFGVLLNPLSLQYGVATWVIGTTLALMGFVGNITAMVANPFINQIAPRPMIMTCGFLTSLGLVLASVAQSWTIFAIALIFIMGIGQRFAAVVIFSILQNYFDKHFGLASAILNAGRPIGTLAFAPLTQMFVFTYGNSGTVLLLGAISFHITLVGASLKPQKKQSLQEEGHPETERHGCCRKLMNLFQFDLLRNPALLSLLAAGFAHSYGFQAWIIYLIPNALEKGLSAYQSTALATVGGVSQLIGLVLSGLLIDSMLISGNMVCLVGLISAGISFALNPWSNGYFSLMINSFVFGCAVASVGVCLLTRVKNISDGSSSVSITIWSELFLAGAFGRLVSGTLTGWFYEQTGSYNISFLVVSGVYLVAGIILAVEMACTDTKPAKI